MQSAHVLRRRTGRADWLAIERIYEALFALTGSPVVAVNRAIALAETRGARAGLEALDALASDARLADYQPYWAARAEPARAHEQREDADLAYERAIGLESDPVVREFLARRRAQLRSRAEPSERCLFRAGLARHQGEEANMTVELVTIAVAVVLSALSEAALGALAASRFRSDAECLERPLQIAPRVSSRRTSRSTHASTSSSCVGSTRSGAVGTS